MHIDVRRSTPPGERARIQFILSPLTILELDEDAAKRFTEIKAATLRMGRPVGDPDLLIASIAQVNVCTVLTRNPRHFQHLSGLKVETC